jgi:hypothetical protein
MDEIIARSAQRVMTYGIALASSSAGTRTDSSPRISQVMPQIYLEFFSMFDYSKIKPGFILDCHSQFIYDLVTKINTIEVL